MKKTIILDEANRYVERQPKLKDDFRQTFHIMPPVGWMNDPNGLCYANGKYHVFFQFHPYSAEWGPMHWGHYQSSDLINWTWQGVVMAPDKEYDSFGCFSGSAIEKDGKIYVLYTGVSGDRQEQILATSDDGIIFEKHGVVIDRAKLPEGAMVGEFRDPKIFKRGENFFAVVGSKTADNGIITLFDSKDLVNWNGRGVLFSDVENSAVSECPDLLQMRDKDLLIYCSSRTKNDEVCQENKYVIGKFDEKNCVFIPEKYGKLDYGDSFYATQSFIAKDGRVLILSWMHTWKDFYTCKYGWSGSLTFPREIEIQNGELIQRPIRELETLFDVDKGIIESNITITDEVAINGVNGLAYSLKLSVNCNLSKGFCVRLFARENSSALDLHFDKSNDSIAVYKDNKKFECDSFSKGARLKLHILVDKTSAEIFVGEGDRTLTFNINPSFMSDGIKFLSIDGKSTVELLEFYPILKQ